MLQIIPQYSFKAISLSPNFRFSQFQINSLNILFYATKGPKDKKTKKQNEHKATEHHV